MISSHPLLLFSSRGQSQRASWPGTGVVISNKEMRLQVVQSTALPCLPSPILSTFKPSTFKPSVWKSCCLFLHHPTLFLLCGLMTIILGILFLYCLNCAYLNEKFWGWKNARNPSLLSKSAVSIKWSSPQFVRQTASSWNSPSASLSLGVLARPYI